MFLIRQKLQSQQLEYHCLLTVLNHSQLASIYNVGVSMVLSVLVYVHTFRGCFFST